MIERIISENNVSYNTNLYGKVASNGSLNAWQAFCNDSPIPRPIEEEVATTAEIKNYIIEYITNAQDSQLTSKMYLNLADGYTLADIETYIGNGATIIKQNKLTGSYLVECESIDVMKSKVIELNDLNMVNYAEPVYKVLASTTK